MMNDQTYGQIESYLSGEMTPDEKRSFESQLSVDPELKQQFELISLANEAILQKRLVDVSRLAQEHHSNVKRNKLRNNRLLLSGGAILIIALSALFFVNLSDDNTNNQTRAALKEEKGIKSVSGSLKSTKEELQPKKKIASKVESTASIPKPSPIEKQQNIDLTGTEESNEHPRISIGSEYSMSSLEVKNNEQEISFEDNAVIEKPDPCSLNVPELIVSTTSECLGSSKGSAAIELSDGSEILDLQISDLSDMSPVDDLQRLGKGNYQIQAITSKHCKLVHKLVIERTLCLEDRFSPGMDQQWKVPAIGSDAQLEIYDPNGVLYFRTNLTAFDVYRWNGQGIKGKLVKGYYIYRILIPDSGEEFKGDITID